MTTQYLDVQGGRLAYEVTGTGPLVICAPSMGDLRQEYRFLAPRLAEAGYRVAMFDVRGHGESSVGWDDYSVAGVGADMVALARALGNGQPAILVGDSMAGGAAIWAAAERPEVVSALVLLDPVVRDFPTLALQMLMMRALFARPWGASAWRHYYTSLYRTTRPTDLASYVKRLGANLRERGRLEALRAMIFASKAASAERVSRVATPALVVMGTKDPDFKDPEREARWLGEQLHCEVRMIAGAGHYPHAEMPEQVAAAALRFLAGVQKGVAHGAYQP
ncbi:MAG TPA: alpha/beta fold hydrolase [Ktedonobacterales bacterium]|jgi:pimeloyl-ACP methyl ester carboxylesterase|nr:alpha/beta fold hydrolase [Ktedonobacterales bacterium]